jgi:hypothetical protein
LGGLEGTIFTIALIAVVLVLAVYVGKAGSALARRRGWNIQDVGTGIMVAVAVTFAFQFVSFANDLARAWPQFFYRPPKLAAAPAPSKAAVKPDIYYIVLEDYANQDVLKQQFGFDNSSFTNFLKDQGYSTYPGAQVNYPYTAMSVASTLSAGYLNDLVSHFAGAGKQTVVPFNETIRDAPVAQALKSAGYKYDLVGNWYEGFNLSRQADTQYEVNGILTVLGHKFVLSNFAKDQLLESAFGRLVQMGIHIGKTDILGYTNEGDADLAHYQFDTLKQLASAPAGGRFIVADVMVPHEPPFFFNADGSLSATNEGDNVGKPLRKKYLGEIQYANSQIKGVLQQINQQSHGQAVVILRSDEGLQLLDINQDNFSESNNDEELLNGDMTKWSQPNLDLKYGTLAAVKLPGIDPAAVTADATSSVNVFRLVLNSYMGYHLPYLPNCYYAYPDGRNYPMKFTDITSRMSSATEDTRCGADGSVK